MAAFAVDSETVAALGFDLDDAIAAYQTALAEHALTEGIPAPLAHPLVEKIVKMHAGEWTEIGPDTFYSTGDGAEQLIVGLADASDAALSARGLTRTARPTAWHAWDETALEWTASADLKRALVSAERDRRIAAFAFGGVAYQLDGASQQRITAMGADARFAVLAGAGEGNLRWADPDSDFGWIAADNTVTPMDAPTMVAFSDAAKLWVIAHTFGARALKDADPLPDDFADDKWWPA